MKKTIITTLLIFISLFANAQDDTNIKDDTSDQLENSFFEKGNAYWAADATFGIIATWSKEADIERLKEGTNVGVTLGVSRTFESNLFTSASVSFSVAESTGLWENPLDYFAVNLEGGYKFKTGTLFVPFLAIGANFINAPNTIVDSKSSIAFSPSAGANFWIKNSTFGVTTKFGYKIASDDYMGSHSFLTVGIIKKF